MKITILLALVAATSLALASDFPKGSPDFKDSSTSAMSAAKTSGKPVVLVFSASWCPPCQAMKRDVYPSAEVKAFHDKFVWAYIDVDDARNESAATKYGVNGIPHIEFLNAGGKEVGKQVGGTSSKEFAKTLQSVLTKANKS
ncbi:thioredoxin family protein [Prosthecobacter sp.]|uniref:thioredoxin family protein n=1 Tax=Prosthecobacter sp. TaxID=1965333 RepID=UPI00248818AB|nr:thioredoxin family protein [Prosthecobacter sp.]MDI1313115.1 thioredoxin family protein [Prosthecobacter sp.]